MRIVFERPVASPLWIGSMIRCEGGAKILVQIMARRSLYGARELVPVGPTDSFEATHSLAATSSYGRTTSSSGRTSSGRGGGSGGSPPRRDPRPRHQDHRIDRQGHPRRPLDLGGR